MRSTSPFLRRGLLCLPLCHGLALAQVPVQSQAPPGPDLAALAHCASLGGESDRLACYDKAMGRAPAATATTTAANPAATPSPGTTPASTSLLAAKGAAHEPASLLAKFWELEPQTQRGVFNFVGYRPNYVLPLHFTSRINRQPQSPTQAPVDMPNYRRDEAKFQLSLRSKLLQDVGLPGGDLWVGFTQQAMWQIWNGRDSKPFRNSDYEPEVMYVVPTTPRLRELPLGWQWRYSLFGLAHQSNGQSDPLSRSWNRLNFAVGFERGDWSLITRLSQRLGERPATDNNPDLVAFRGRAEFQLNWAQGAHTASLLYRSSLRDVKYGALQLEWTYPVFADQPNGLRWYVQAFRGYGETLTDYNFRQTSIGAGLSFLQF